MLIKPNNIFARDDEWQALSRFMSPSPNRKHIRAGSGAGKLGIVSGRRRQGKTFLLSALVKAVGGFLFVASDDTEIEALRRLGEALAQKTGGGRFHFRNWDEAIEVLYATLPNDLIVIDEFPYLIKASPVLPSLIQRALDPGGKARASDSQLILCGSAMSVMGNLLSGNAPLRGRASLELIVKPMGYRTAAELWNCHNDPELAVLLHSIVGGTPAYRHEFANSAAPTTLADFDDWVIRTILQPKASLFRESRYLLAEETDIRDPALYHAVLNAIASGNNTRGGIANYLGRPASHIGHPLTVLEDCALITKEMDAFRPGKVRYRIAEPLITFYEAIMRRNWSLLELGQAQQAWQSSQSTFASQVVGPHFETLCREFALAQGFDVFGELPGEVAAGTVADPTNKTQIDIDVVVLAPGSPEQKRAVISLGEVKWGTTMGTKHLRRLQRARDLLAVKGFDMSQTKLACYSGAGFDAELREAATKKQVLLIGLDELYGLS